MQYIDVMTLLRQFEEDKKTNEILINFVINIYEEFEESQGTKINKLTFEEYLQTLKIKEKR